ncbi:MAG: hypothetical protein ACHQJD_00760 [Thermoanaerobaculia bacterium]
MEQTRRRVLAARILAVVADAVQLGLLPLFAEGAASVVNDALDAVIAIVMVVLVGWHWAFVPAFLAELVPVVDLAPTWTLAVFFATRRGGAASRQPSANAASPQPDSSQPRLLPPGDRAP